MTNVKLHIEFLVSEQLMLDFGGLMLGRSNETREDVSV